MVRAIRGRWLCLFCMAFVFLLFCMRILGLPFPVEPAFLHSQNLEEVCEDTVTIIGTIEEGKVSDGGISYILKDAYLVRPGKSGDSQVQLKGLSLFVKDEERLPVGSVLQCRGSLSPVEEAGNPGQFDSRLYYACQNVWFSMYAENLLVLKEGGGVREAMAVWKEHFTEELNLLLDEDCVGILCAMLLGDRSLLTDDTKVDFKISGMMHMLCISGMHIMLLGMGLFRLLMYLLLALPPLFSESRKNVLCQMLAAFLAVCSMLVYGYFVGNSVSVLRAVIMFAIRLLARVCRRSYDHFSAMALAAVLLLAWNPYYCFYSGFQMSFAAVLGIALVLPLTEKMQEGLGESNEIVRKGIGKGIGKIVLWGGMRDSEGIGKRLGIRLQQGFLGWLSVTLASLPILLLNYYEIPIWSCFMNMLLVPGAAFFMVSGILGCLVGFYSLPLGRCILYPTVLFLHGFDRLMRCIRFLPLNTLILGCPKCWQVLLYYLGLAGLLFCGYRRLPGSGKEEGCSKETALKKRSFFARIFVSAPAIISLSLVMMTLLFVRFPKSFSITALDVGQGDCLVVQTEAAATFLVDGGSSSVKSVGQYRILPYLKHQGISHVDGVVISHADLDHYNGILELFEMVRDRKTSLSIGSLLLPCWMKEAEEPAEREGESSDGQKIREILQAAGEANVPVFYVKNGDEIVAGETRIRVLHPNAHSAENEGNAGSVVLEVETGDFSALLTGDVEGKGEDELLPLSHTYDYLKVAHHGSHNSTSDVFLQEASPGICVFSAPLHSRYGHPHQETVDKVEAIGTRWWQTGISGAIRVEAGDKKGNEIIVKTFR